MFCHNRICSVSLGRSTLPLQNPFKTYMKALYCLVNVRIITNVAQKLFLMSVFLFTSAKLQTNCTLWLPMIPKQARSPLHKCHTSPITIEGRSYVQSSSTINFCDIYWFALSQKMCSWGQISTLTLLSSDFSTLLKPVTSTTLVVISELRELWTRIHNERLVTNAGVSNVYLTVPVKRK